MSAYCVLQVEDWTLFDLLACFLLKAPGMYHAKIKTPSSEHIVGLNFAYYFNHSETLIHFFQIMIKFEYITDQKCLGDSLTMKIIIQWIINSPIPRK